MTRILIVDDSPLERKRIEHLLNRRLPAYETVMASDGEAALAILESRPVDLILTDLQMPSMNGLQLVEKVHASYARVAVILLTGFGSEEIAVQALAYGAAGYVPKREMSNNLIDTIEQVLQLRKFNSTKLRLLAGQRRLLSTFVLDNDAELVQPLVSYVQEQILHFGCVGERDVVRVAVALTEALLNAIHHGNLEVSSDLRQQDESIYELVINERRQLEPYCNRRVHVTIDLSPEAAIFQIRDEGPGFDARAALDPRREFDFERIGGRGLLLIRSFVDVVYHNATGNEIHLIKYAPKAEQSTVGNFTTAATRNCSSAIEAVA